MKIEAPLRSYQEVKPLLQAGADILYCGVIGDGVNNRNNNILHQFSSISELKKAANLIHEEGKQIYLTLNSINSNNEQCLRQVEMVVDQVVDGLIVAELQLMKQICEKFPKFPIILSCLTGINNSKCLDVYCLQNVISYCFERNISLRNMEECMKKHSNLRATAFVSGNCNNTQLICQLHNLNTKIPIYKQEGGFGELICENWYYKNPKTNHQVAMEMLNTNNWCALCALYRMQKMGIYALKIEGRGLDLEYKLQKVHYYKQALQMLNKVKGKKEFLEVCKTFFREEYHRKCDAYDCFYQEM